MNAKERKERELQEAGLANKLDELTSIVEGLGLKWRWTNKNKNYIELFVTDPATGEVTSCSPELKFYYFLLVLRFLSRVGKLNFSASTPKTAASDAPDASITSGGPEAPKAAHALQYEERLQSLERTVKELAQQVGALQETHPYTGDGKSAQCEGERQIKEWGKDLFMARYTEQLDQLKLRAEAIGGSLFVREDATLLIYKRPASLPISKC